MSWRQISLFQIGKFSLYKVSSIVHFVEVPTLLAVCLKKKKIKLKKKKQCAQVHVKNDGGGKSVIPFR